MHSALKNPIVSRDFVHCALKITSCPRRAPLGLTRPRGGLGRPGAQLGVSTGTTHWRLSLECGVKAAKQKTTSPP